jgi:cytochrome c oxidase subunit 4
MKKETKGGKFMEDIKEKQNPRPFSKYLLIWLGLLMLTGVMVTLAGLNLGQLSILGAIAIAAVNSTLVVLFFMHIKFEDRVFKILLGLAVFIMAAVMVITFIDASYG